MTAKIRSNNISKIIPKTKKNTVIDSLDDAQFKQFTDKFDILTKLIAISIIQNKPLKEQVQTLHSAGMPISDISKLLNRKMTDLGQYLYRKPKPKSSRPSK